ncbi:uncharacterized protein FFB14_03020 [Fusarium fujikuroi]|nr:uncharacterized protein FFB14_03020 [Fusarium fujikuroi]
MRPVALETVLQDWVVSHNGRLWLRTEELTAIIDQTGFTKSQVTNWFVARRKATRRSLECLLLEKPTEFILAYNIEEAKVQDIRHFFATFAENGYLPEAGKSVIAESTGLSTRSIVDLFDKLRRDARFSTAATAISKQADGLQPFDVPSSQLSTSSKLTPGSTATVHSARPSTPSHSQGNQRGVDTPCPVSAVSAPSPTTIPETPRKRKRDGAILPSGHMFAWHRGRQVNLTTEVEPLILNHPSVQSASCLS